MLKLSLASHLRLALAKAESENRMMRNTINLHSEQLEIWMRRIKEMESTVKAINEERAKNR